MQASSLSGFALHAAKQMAGAVWLGNDDYEENSERWTGWCVLPVCPHVLSIWTARRRCFCRMICGSGLDRERSRTVWTVSGVEGVPAGHIVHFILDAVEQLPITDFRVNDRGTGSEQYPPRMMLALLR